MLQSLLQPPPSQAVPQRCCHLQQNANSLAQERLQCLFETVWYVGTVEVTGILYITAKNKKPQTWNVITEQNQYTSDRGPTNDNRTGSNSRPFSMPSATSNIRMTKKYLKFITQHWILTKWYKLSDYEHIKIRTIFLASKSNCKTFYICLTSQFFSSYFRSGPVPQSLFLGIIAAVRCPSWHLINRIKALKSL